MGTFENTDVWSRSRSPRAPHEHELFGVLPAGFAARSAPVREPHDLHDLRSAAPERVRLESPAHADARSEVWGVGVAVYAMLTGRFPFDADSVDELRARIASGRFVPVGRLRPDVACGLADVVHRCLELDPTLRYATPAEVALALAPYANLTTKDTAGAPARPSRGLIAAVLVVATLVVAGAGAALVIARNDAGAGQVARSPRIVAMDKVASSRASDAVTAKAPTALPAPRLLTATDILGY